jgi:hypothetical protein
MCFLTILTIIFIALKVTGQIDWNWFLVLAPCIVEVIGYIVVGGFFGWIFKKIMESE